MTTNFKKFKINQLQKIKQQNQYIYLFRYTDLKFNEILLLKKTLKNLNYKLLIFKQTFSKNLFQNITGQGSLLIIYGNKININIIQQILIFKKLQLLYLINNNNIYSNFKCNTLIQQSKNSLHITIIKPFLIFLYYLRKIN
jgi:ribosomal protein L10